MNQFDEVLPREGLSTAKWEMEIDRLGNPDLLCFGTAEMDFRSPPVVVEALRAAVDRGHFGYPYRPDAYFEAVRTMFASHGWKVNREWISSNVGIYPSMRTVIEELTEPGDEVVLQTPVHHPFKELIVENNRVPLENPLTVVDDKYVMDLDALAESVTERTRLLLLCNPHNPVGRVWTREELARLDDFCRDRGIVVVADEVYYGLVHAGADYVPFASLSRETSLNTVTLTSASKTFNLTGFKHSLVVSENEQFIAAYDQGLHRNTLFYGGSVLGIVAAQAAFQHGAPWSRELMEYIANNRALLRERMAQILPDVQLFDAEGTYLAWLDFRSLGLDDAALVSLFETEAGVIVLHGALLGTGGSGHVRWNLACPSSVLDAGLTRLEEALARRSSA